MATAEPFDFSRAMYRLCQDVVSRLEPLRHIRMPNVAVTFAQTRSRVAHGLQAKLTPMRFEDGELTTRRYGRQWTVQRLYHGEHEVLYILTFYLPRFLEHSFREKMITVVHELYHISPEFNGDIRRLGGRYHVHSHSQKEYDRQCEGMAEEYLRRRPSPAAYEFLKMDFRTLHARHGGVVGLRVPIPKLIPLSRSA
jgi:predicted metallopeptidase